MTETSLPVLPVRETICWPGEVAWIWFKRRSSIAAVQAAVETGRLLVLARQRDPEESRPSRKDLYAIGVLAELLDLKREDSHYGALVRAMQPVRIISTDSDSRYLRLKATAAAEFRSGEAGRVEGEAPADLVTGWVDPLPLALHELRSFLRYELSPILSGLGKSTELSLQHQTSNAITQWLSEHGVRTHFEVIDNPHMRANQRFADIKVKHISGEVAIEVKNNDNLEKLVGDVRKLRAYMRPSASLTKLGVLVFPSRRDTPIALLREFVADPRLIMVRCARR